jgi:hypothetical protein
MTEPEVQGAIIIRGERIATSSLSPFGASA